MFGEPTRGGGEGGGSKDEKESTDLQCLEGHVCTVGVDKLRKSNDERRVVLVLPLHQPHLLHRLASFGITQKTGIHVKLNSDSSAFAELLIEKM